MCDTFFFFIYDLMIFDCWGGEKFKFIIIKNNGRIFSTMRMNRWWAERLIMVTGWMNWTVWIHLYPTRCWPTQLLIDQKNCPTTSRSLSANIINNVTCILCKIQLLNWEIQILKAQKIKQLEIHNVLTNLSISQNEKKNFMKLSST